MNMKKKNIMAVVVALLLVILSATTVAATSKTTVEGAMSTSTATPDTYSIELETRSALLIDRSGSMEDRQKVDEILSQLDLTSYDSVVYFDHRQSSTDPQFVGGGNSFICEKIDEMATSGFTHISVVTDGQQWPRNYEALGIYTDLDVKLYLTEETVDSEELINKLEGRLVNSSLKVVTPEGTEKVVLNDYKAPIYNIEIPRAEELEEGNTTTSESSGKQGNCKWWLALILGMLIAALFDFIHELITRGRDNTGSTATTTNGTVGTVKPLPQAVVDKIAQGYRILADFSGSMAAQQSATVEACKKAGTSESVICFGDSVKECKVSKLARMRAAGQTAGWEAVKTAMQNGWEEIMIVSDLGFNKMSFEEAQISGKFKKIMVVTPTSFDRSVFENLKTIADEIEVVSL